MCGQLLILPMGGTPSLGRPTTQFESGTSRLVLRSARLQRGTLIMCSQLFALPTRAGVSSQCPAIGLFTRRIHFQAFLTQFSPQLFKLDGQTQTVGSGIQWAAYSIGYRRTAAQASIHLQFSQSLPHPLFGQFLFNLKGLSLEPFGPKSRTPHKPSLSFCARFVLY